MKGLDLIAVLMITGMLLPSGKAVACEGALPDDEEQEAFFAAIDTDHDGFIGVAELTEHYNSLGVQDAAALVAQTIKDADEDRNGKLSAAEFFNDMTRC